MSIKLHGNGRWESSRMMLPEHKEAIVRESAKCHEKRKPSFCEEELLNLYGTITKSYNDQNIVVVRIYGLYGDREIEATITKVDTFREKVRIDFEEGYEWIKVSDITQIQLQ